VQQLLKHTQNDRIFYATIAMLFCLFSAGIWWLIPHPVIPLVLSMLPIGILFVLKYPSLIALLFLSFSFFRIHEVFPVLMPLQLPLLLALATLVSLSWNVYVKKLKMFMAKEHKIFLMFLVVVTIGLFFATNRSVSIESYSGTFIKIAIMVFALSWMLTTEKSYRLLNILVLSAGTSVALKALYNKSNGLEMLEGTRVTIGNSIGSILGDPNDLSLVLLFPASFAMAQMLTPRVHWMQRIIGFLIFALIVFAIIATQSRGGLLGILAVMAVFGSQIIRSKVVLGTIGVVALLGLFAVAGVADRQSGGAHEAGIDESAMGRLHAWSAASRMALDNPLTGVGLDNFYQNYFDYSKFWDGKNHAVHSTWFGVLAEAGILGFILFATLVFLTGLKAYKTYIHLKHNPESSPIVHATSWAVLSGLAGFCVSGTFLTMGFHWPFYMMLAMTLGLSRNVFSTCPSK
jgi:probable O-glycosylation ligase (exosortase A-associated)